MVYILLHFALFGMFLYARNNEKAIKRVTVISAILVFLLVAWRHPSMGRDLGTTATWEIVTDDWGYINSFYQIGNMDWLSVFASRSYLNYSFAYIILNKALYFIIPHHQFLLTVCAAFSVIPVWVLFSKCSKDVYLSSIAYLALPVFLLSYSGLRQAIAIGICCLACVYIERKKFISFAVIVIVATLFHSSAALFLLAYPLYHIKLTHKTRLLFLPMLPLVYLFRNQIFLLLLRIFNVDREVNGDNSFVFFVVLTGIYIFALLFFNEEHNGWMNLLFTACLIQALAGVNMIVMRVGYYFLIAMPILIANVINSMPNRKEKALIHFLICVGFVAYGLYSIMNSSWAEAYPYYFFWETL